MSGRVRIIDGKGDWDSTPPTGVDTGDWSGFETDVVSQGGVVDLSGGDLLVEELDTPGMAVTVAPGTVYVDNASWVANSFENKFFQVVQDAEEELEISSNSSGSTRIDLICQKVDTVTTPDDTAENVQELVVVEGTPGDGAPATPENHELLAEVEVADSATSITSSEIEDKRRQMRIDAGKLQLANDVGMSHLNDSDVEVEGLKLNDENVFELPHLLTNGLSRHKQRRADIYANGNSGASKTIDLSNGETQSVILTEDTVTLTPSNLGAGEYLTLIVFQDGDGGNSIAWGGGAYIDSNLADEPDNLEIPDGSSVSFLIGIRGIGGTNYVIVAVTGALASNS